MASLIMHLCVAKILTDEKRIKSGDEHEFLLGTLLPDFALVPNAHYRTSEKGKSFFDITKFREEYIDKIKSSPLYLGYYLHLVQDVIFRDMMYNKYLWDPKNKENVPLLYGDYRRLNAYLSDKYSLSADMLKGFEAFSKSAAREFIYEHFYLKDCLKTDLTVKEGGNYFFLSPDIAEEYICRAIELCRSELLALDAGKGYIDEKQYAWK